VVAGIGDHQVVKDAALGIGELGVAHPPDVQAGDVAGHQALQHLGGASTGDAGLAHMRDIEQTGRGARVLVFAEHAQRILHRHVVAGERHHLGTEVPVQGGERGGLERGVGHRNSERKVHATGNPVHTPLCPET